MTKNEIEEARRTFMIFTDLMILACEEKIYTQQEMIQILIAFVSDYMKFEVRVILNNIQDVKKYEQQN